MNCPICNSTQIIDLIELKNLPIYCNILLDTYEEALKIPKKNINFVYCENCGHFFNASFNPNDLEYSGIYENSLQFSDTFQQYAVTLVNYLIDKFNLKKKTIIDIGCGRGDFLRLICDSGDNTGFGFDKSYVPDGKLKQTNPKISFIPDFYSSKYDYIRPDMILCRHVLEHIYNPLNFLQTLNTSNSNRNSIYFFEVPNVLHILNNLSVWDIIYEHYSYFSLSSVTHLFEKAGMQILRLKSVFKDQFIQIEAQIMGQSRLGNHVTIPSLADINKKISGFHDQALKKILNFKKQVRTYESDRKKMVVWGAGSKGITFLNLVKSTSIEYIVDINPRKHGKFVSGTGQKIVPVEFLSKYKPDVIFIMNAIYINEITHTLESMGLNPALIEV